MEMNAEQFKRWLSGDDFAGLAAIEVDGRVHFPASLKKRDKTGKVVEEPVMLRVIRTEERAKARHEARKWLTELELDQDKDSDQLESLDMSCILARAIRSAKEPYEQHMTAKDLIRSYDTSTLSDIWDRHNELDRRMNPRPTVIDEATINAMIGALAKAGHLGPLAAIDGPAQDSLVLSMAKRLRTSQTSSS